MLPRQETIEAEEQSGFSISKMEVSLSPTDNNNGKFKEAEQKGISASSKLPGIRCEV